MFYVRSGKRQEEQAFSQDYQVYVLWGIFTRLLVVS